MILMSKYKGQHGGKKCQKARLPPPPSGNAQKKSIFYVRSSITCSVIEIPIQQNLAAGREGQACQDSFSNQTSPCFWQRSFGNEIKIKSKDKVDAPLWQRKKNLFSAKQGDCHRQPSLHCLNGQKVQNYKFGLLSSKNKSKKA